MFGEYSAGGGGESPRLPSPWQALSTSASNASPSPLALRSPTNSSPGTPNNNNNNNNNPILSTSPTYHGLEFEFESLSLDKSESAIEAEVDKSGHIEYKLKLPCPSPLRLAKLTTQLKWRLVEGGGVAIYEIGILDDGQVIGLVQEEMEESLATLGKMLGGLGGGQIKIVRVIKVGGETPNKRENNGSYDSGGESSDEASASASSISSTSSLTFQSFTVEDSPPDHLAFSSPRTHSPSNSASNTTTSPNHHNSKYQAMKDRHSRSPAERANFKHRKKEERKARKLLESDEPPRPVGDYTDYTQVDLERAAWRLLNPKPPPIPRVHHTPARTLPEGMKYRPEMGVKEGQVRYAVEAAVFKKSSLLARRASSSGELDSDELFGGGEEEEREEDEGWSHLEFDRIQL